MKQHRTTDHSWAEALNSLPPMGDPPLENM